MTYSVFQTLISFPAALRESITSAAAWCVAEISDVDEFVGEGAKAVRRHFEDLLSWDESCVESGWSRFELSTAEEKEMPRLAPWSRHGQVTASARAELGFGERVESFYGRRLAVDKKRTTAGAFRPIILTSKTIFL